MVKLILTPINIINPKYLEHIIDGMSNVAELYYPYVKFEESNTSLNIPDFLNGEKEVFNADKLIRNDLGINYIGILIADVPHKNNFFLNNALEGLAKGSENCIFLSKILFEKNPYEDISLSDDEINHNIIIEITHEFQDIAVYKHLHINPHTMLSHIQKPDEPCINDESIFYDPELLFSLNHSLESKWLRYISLRPKKPCSYHKSIVEKALSELPDQSLPE